MRIRRQTLLEQTIAAVREGIATGRWNRQLPGVRPLASELGVSPSTVQKAIQCLENDGSIVAKGPGRRRVSGAISKGTGRARAMEEKEEKRTSLRVGILLRDSRTSPHLVSYLPSLIAALEKAGHTPVFSPKPANALRDDPKRILEMLNANPADCWIGTTCSRPVLEAIAVDLKKPFLAWGGNTKDLEMATAGVNFVPAIRACTRRLLELGHRRIVLAAPESWRKPTFGKSVVAFREELAAAGIVAGDYHVPNWDVTKEGFWQLLESLFTLTPPTAMIVDDAPEILALVNFLAARGSFLPRDLSVVAMTNGPALAWSRPSLAHLETPHARVDQRIVRWVNACATGVQDRTSILYDVVFVDGESVAAPGR